MLLPRHPWWDLVKFHRVRTLPVPAEVNPRAGTERTLPLPSAPSPLGRLIKYRCCYLPKFCILFNELFSVIAESLIFILHVAIEIHEPNFDCCGAIENNSKVGGYRCASLTCITWVSCITCITCTTEISRQLIPWDIIVIAGIPTSQRYLTN